MEVCLCVHVPTNDQTSSSVSSHKWGELYLAYPSKCTNQRLKRISGHV